VSVLEIAGVVLFLAGFIAIGFVFGVVLASIWDKRR